MRIMSNEQQRTELHRTIWNIADELRGAVGGWEFKAYVLGTLFYRFISENLTDYINRLQQEAGMEGFDTDDKGNITQYDAYLPYGELLVDEHSSSEELPYKFNGKELDEETALYYYGARYMQPVASIWYGVDPLFEDYPQSSPYTYCMDNPLKLIDPDGRGWIQTKDGLYYNPRVHSQNDISKRDTQKGFKYMGETFQNKNKGISYRSDIR